MSLSAPTPTPRASVMPAFMQGEGKAAARLRAHDWGSTPLGSPDTWHSALRAAVRVMLATAQPCVIVWGNGQTCLYNEAYCCAFVDGREAWALGWRASDMLPEVWPTFGPQLANAMAGNATAPDNSTVVSMRSRGTPAHVWACTLTLIDDERAPSGIGGGVVLCSEVGEVEPANDRLHASEARWRKLFEQAPGFTCMLSGPQHVFEYCNPAYRALTGRDDLQGRQVADVFPWAVEQGFVALLDRVYQTGEPYTARSAPLNIPERDGSPRRYLDFVYQPLRDAAGRVTGVMVMGDDVTEQRHAEAALHESEQRLRIASEAAALGVYDLDLRSQTLHWDARMQALWGSDQAGSVSHERMMQGVHGDDRQTKLDALERASTPGGDGHFHCEYRVVDAGVGVTRWIQAHGQVLFDGVQPLRVIGTVQDISERKQADARRDEFLATLGHELRNPLAPIGNALKVLNRDVQRGGSAGHALAVVDRQFHHVVRLVDDLLDAVRLQHGRFALRKSRVSLVDVVAQAIETASARLEEGGNRLQQRMPRETVWLDADAVRLAQVISNLLSNASKYSEPGSVIELVAERRDPDMLRLTVHDRGIGIEPAFLERMFETFSQAQLAIERTQGGLGIGLALARGIVELHGGRITAHSQGLGHGSEFVLELPLAAQRCEGQRRDERRVEQALRPVAETAGDARADMRLAGRRILLVEDNHDHAETLSVLLGLYGARVRWAPDGLSALEAAREHRPDTILLDIGLPGMNGYEVCRQLRAEPWGKSVGIFALTGWGQPGDRQRTHEAGFDHHLLKPVDFDALLSLLTH